MKSDVPQHRYRKRATKILDGLILCNFIFLVILVISGGFSFTILGSAVYAHDTENPSIIFVVLVILRKLINRQESMAEILVIKQVDKTIKWVKKTVSGIPPLILVWILIGGYMVLMSLVSVNRHGSYHSHAYDLGIFDQVIWNISQGNGAMSSILGNRHFFGEHVSPVLYLLAPLYLVFSTPAVILIAQSVALALGAFPIYKLACKQLASQQLAIVFASMYLCYQPLRNVNLYDFHPVAFTTPLLLFAFYYGEQRKYMWFGLFVFLALLCKEEVASIVFIFGVYIACVQKREKLGIALSLVGVTMFVLDIFVIIPYYRQAPFGFVSRYSYLGKSIPEITKTLLFRPLYVLKYVFIMKKIKYVFQVFGPLGFLSLLSPAHLLLAVPTFFQNILSGSGIQYSIGFQYTSPLTPFVFVSAIYGGRNLLMKPVLRQRLKLRAATPQIIQGVSVLFVILCVLFFGKSPISRLRQYARTEHTAAADAFLESIPRAASVSAQGPLVPHLTHREHIYQFPVINAADYIVLDITAKKWPIPDEEYRTILKNLLQGEYGVLESKDGLLLLKRGHDPSKNTDIIPLLGESGSE